MIQVSTSSWHYRMACRTHPFPSRSLCGYAFEVLIGLMFFVVLTTVFSAGGVLYILGGVSFLDGSWRDNPFAVAFLSITIPLVGFVAIGAFVGVVSTASDLASDTFAQTSAGKIWDGIKKKYCPSMEFKDE